MVALVAAGGVFHVAQKGVHFGQGELAAGAHRAVAGEGGENVVFALFYGLAGAGLGEFAQHVAGEGGGVAFAKHGGDGKHGYLSVLGGQADAVAFQCGDVVGEGGGFFAAGGEQDGDKQGLAVQAA